MTSASTSGSLEPKIPSRILQIDLQLFFEMMIFRNSIRNGTKFSALVLCNLEIHEKKAGLDDHRLKTMVKRTQQFSSQVTCSSDSSEGSCRDVDCTGNALNDARTCMTTQC